MTRLKKILISNDDGLGSPFLKPFLRAFQKVAEELVCVVPAAEQSWIGRAYSRHRSLTLKEIEGFGNARIFTIDGTPADCVNIALAHVLNESPDALVSGINIGHNLALPLLWSSGTFSAAVEGAARGIPAFACSLQLENEHYELCRLRHEAVPESLNPSLQAACAHAANFAAKIVSENSAQKYSVYNINYPSDFCENSEFKMTTPAKVEVQSLYKKAPNGLFEFSYAIGENIFTDGELTDIECIKNSMASCSVIKIM